MFCFLIEEDPSEATGVSATSKSGTEQFVWLDEEQEGQPLPKRRRTGEKQKPGLGRYHHPHASRKMRERNSPSIKEVLLTPCRCLSRIRLKPLPVLMPLRLQLMPVDANLTHTKKVLEALCRHLVVGVLISLCLHMVTLHYSLISLLDCKSIVCAILKLTIST